MTVRDWSAHSNTRNLIQNTDWQLFVSIYWQTFPVSILLTGLRSIVLLIKRTKKNSFVRLGKTYYISNVNTFQAVQHRDILQSYVYVSSSFCRNYSWKRQGYQQSKARQSKVINFQANHITQCSQRMIFGIFL